jgi:hypothetical protein
VPIEKTARLGGLTYMFVSFANQIRGNTARIRSSFIWKENRTVFRPFTDNPFASQAINGKVAISPERLHLINIITLICD